MVSTKFAIGDVIITNFYSHVRVDEVTNLLEHGDRTVYLLNPLYCRYFYEDLKGSALNAAHFAVGSVWESRAKKLEGQWKVLYGEE